MVPFAVSRLLDSLVDSPYRIVCRYLILQLVDVAPVSSRLFLKFQIKSRNSSGLQFSNSTNLELYVLGVSNAGFL